MSLPDQSTPGAAQTETRSPTERRWFSTTSWTAVVAAGQAGSPEAREALAKLCQTYWEPLYAYLRRAGQSDADAKDLTQEFFFRLVSKNYLGAANRQKGKFRSFLLTALKHFLANEWERAHAAKRGGGQPAVSLDELATEKGGARELEMPAELSPATVFERQWARTLLQQAHARLREQYVAAGKADLFAQMEGFLDGWPDAGAYDAVAARLNTTKRAVTVAVYRLRQRFAELIRMEVAHTLVNPTATEVEEEVRHLFETFSQGK